MKYKKYFRKTSLKQKGVGDFFLKEVAIKKPKVFLEIGVFHGVTARNICELLSSFHGKDFKYIGLDLFEESIENKNEIIPHTKFNNPLKTLYFNFIKKHSKQILKGNDLKILKYLVLRSSRNKVHFVVADEKESNKRMILNFGHTFAHGIESSNNFSKKINHGEAVLIGMLILEH